MSRERQAVIAALLALGATILPARAATIQITMQNMASSSAETAAKVGDTVELINKDVLVHSATARNGDFDVTMPAKKSVTMVLKEIYEQNFLS